MVLIDLGCEFYNLGRSSFPMSQEDPDGGARDDHGDALALPRQPDRAVADACAGGMSELRRTRARDCQARLGKASRPRWAAEALHMMTSRSCSLSCRTLP